MEPPPCRDDSKGQTVQRTVIDRLQTLCVSDCFNAEVLKMKKEKWENTTLLCGKKWSGAVLFCFVFPLFIWVEGDLKEKWGNNRGGKIIGGHGGQCDADDVATKNRQMEQLRVFFKGKLKILFLCL